jgi:hypothetical protein
MITRKDAKGIVTSEVNLPERFETAMSGRSGWTSGMDRTHRRGWRGSNACVGLHIELRLTSDFN